MKNSVKAISMVSAVALILVLGAGSFAHAAPAPAAQDGTPAEITVTGSGSVRLVPDKASISFGVTTQDAAADQAQSQNSAAVEKVIAVLTERGVAQKSIRTTGYSMYPQYDYSENGGSRITGYTVCTTMCIQDQNLEDVGKLLSDCVAAGINNVDNIAFLCSGYDGAYRQALAEAVDNARVKAEALAAAAGKTLGDTVAIVEGWQDTSARYRQANDITNAAKDIAPILMPGESEITANVTVTFRMQ